MYVVFVVYFSPYLQRANPRSALRQHWLPFRMAFRIVAFWHLDLGESRVPL